MSSKNNHGKSKARRAKRQWLRMDLHLHTPGSSDYQEPDITYLDILRQAEMRGLHIIAFTDHNTVAGYAAMQQEIEQLLWLERLGRLEPDEKRCLDEYRRLLDKILVLPGFEFTATFGFHILGIFPQETNVSYLEHLLLALNIPPDQLRKGSSTVGATADVLRAYQVINEAGGLVIAAHANSANGVVMRGLDFGGQTRIAYTQDPNLHALEVTDLEKRGRYTTRRFFDGSKPEYPRPMRCIQGSDAHRLVRESSQSKSLGIGDRITEILLEEASFKALASVLKGTDFSLTRPYRGPATPQDFVQLAREEGESIVQAFYPSLAQRGGFFERVLMDICAMANTNGGTIYVGVSANPKEKPTGIRDIKKTIERIHSAVTNRFSPEPDIQMDQLTSQGRQIVRITIQPGRETPYAIDDNKFYVRDESETSLAVRDEIVRLVGKAHGLQSQKAVTAPPAPPVTAPVITVEEVAPQQPEERKIEPPRTGVEVVSSERRKGTIYHTVRDMRNGNLIKNVTKSSARKLWHYAITQVEAGLPKESEIQWQGNIALINQRKKRDHVWYDLALKENDTIHVYYGVTDSGLNDEWLALVNMQES
ncbi:MAG: RNA-binding domain-containing protein [Anaerolineae bacterium]